MGRSFQKDWMDYIRKSLILLLSTATGIFFLTSCGTTRNTTYYFKAFERDTAISAFVDKNMELKICKDDILSIIISSMNKDDDAIYNSSSSLSSGGPSSLSSSGLSNYQVDLEGNIQIHKLGVLHVEGLTRKELKDTLQQLFQPYLLDPIVTVNFGNHTIAVLGQVGKPQQLQLPQGNMPLTDVLALSGDVTAAADIEKVLIIRESDTGRIFKHINMEDKKLFNSSWFYVQPNDIVYVPPNYRKLNQDENRAKTIQYVSIAASIVTIIIVLSNKF
jgi:polysaccharide export outer membrane protein